MKLQQLLSANIMRPMGKTLTLILLLVVMSVNAFGFNSHCASRSFSTDTSFELINKDVDSGSHGECPTNDHRSCQSCHFGHCLIAILGDHSLPHFDFDLPFYSSLQLNIQEGVHTELNRPPIA